MKPDQLRYFLEAARTQHIGRAARQIPISPSAVSHAIAGLERDLGRELFAKRGKRVTLTEHGKRLMERAEGLLREMDAIREDLASEETALRGHYKLGATHVLCARLLAPAWARLQRANPALSAEVYTLRSAQVLRDAAAGELDFGLCFNPQTHPDLDSKPVHEGVLALAVRRGHPVLKLPLAARPAALGRYPAALPKAFQGIDNCESHPMLAKFGLAPRPVFLYDSYEVAAANAIGSDAWCLIPDWIARSYKPELETFVPSGWRAPALVTAVWPKRRPLSRLLTSLIAGIRAELPHGGAKT
ncbi:MAG: LysR family transcriptional regulator [Elusimicrobia bacterium]|nr:LysR family transcriptional regulator [Elusimicrobiota bacterium]